MSGEGTHNVFDPTEILENQAEIIEDIADVQVVVDSIQADVDVIEALVVAEAVLEETGGTLTTDGTEQNVYINNAPAGVYEPLWFNINFTNHTVTETVAITVYYRNVDGGAWVEDDGEVYVGVPIHNLISILLKPTRFGVRVTVEKTAGTNRAYDWEVFYEV